MENPFTKSTGTAAVVVAASALYTAWYYHSRNDLPPGPPRFPVLGNINFPKVQWYENFWKYIDKYGDVVYCEVLGQSTVILGSIEAADELLSKRASNNSRREDSYMKLQVMDMRWRLPRQQPGPLLHEQRKLLRRVTGPQGLPNHQDLIESEIDQLLIELNGFEGVPSSLIVKTIGAVIIQISYGKELWKEHGPELVDLNTESMLMLASTYSKSWLVNHFHWLHYIPSWVPGAQFKRIGTKVTFIQMRLRKEPYAHALRSFEVNGPDGSLASQLFESDGASERIRDVLADLYSGGVEPMKSIIISFLFAMMLYPEVLKKVQEEIDAVVGVDRMPELSDRENLPFCEAAWKESLRWHVSVPLGVPHVSAEEDYYRGFRIPKGTTFITHVAYMMRDARNFHNPEAYMPERWLAEGSESLPDPSGPLFGFGLRACPGKFMGQTVSFSVVLKIASIYDILPLEGETRPIPEYTDSNLRNPKNFKCRFVPRSGSSHRLAQITQRSDDRN